jgi:hypothetical protein
MFLETHLYIIDFEKRYLDLSGLNNLPGWSQIGEWVDHNEYLQLKKMSFCSVILFKNPVPTAGRQCCIVLQPLRRCNDP